MTASQQLQEKYAALGPLLNERQARLWAATAAKADAIGYLDRRGEAEIVIDPARLRGLREVPLARAD